MFDLFMIWYFSLIFQVRNSIANARKTKVDFSLELLSFSAQKMVLKLDTHCVVAQPSAWEPSNGKR